MEFTDKSLKLTKRKLEILESLELENTDDVLRYYPIRYDVLNCAPFDQWAIKEQVTFEGEVVRTARTFRHGKLSTTNFEVMAFDRVLKVTIFNRPWANNLTMNQRITIRGIYMGNGKVTAMSYDLKPLDEHPAITPVYSIKEGIQQRSIRDIVTRVFDAVQNEIDDVVPMKYMRSYRLLHRRTAFEKIHFPESMDDVKQAVRTLKYEEFLQYFLAVQLMHQNENGIYKSPKIYDKSKVDYVIEHLAFTLTDGQKSALDDILKDISSPQLMYRLVQGDVGCGKTVVAGIGLYAAVTAGYQAALLAPTEILARQHMSSLESILKNTGTKIAVLYSGLDEKEKNQILEDTRLGKIDILVGTHALLQDTVQFQNLGFVVADEQQRFGVEQRRALKQKGDLVDFLLMSATPIPRTLASALYGDMDISSIETLPAGRKIPETIYIKENSFRSVLSDVQGLLDSGRQLYVICASVENSENYHARNIYDIQESLTKLFPQYTTGILHGKMTSDQKQLIMSEFANNQIQILIATTVVEVGMNVVNATGMIIYDADRFGLSQLHQLRGRIQRGSDKGYCWLLSGSQEKSVEDRLNVLVKSNDGFFIAQEDLRMRGQGDILGKRQSGTPDFILGNVVEDSAIVKTALQDAKYIVEHQEEPEFAAILDIAYQRGNMITD